MGHHQLTVQEIWIASLTRMCCFFRQWASLWRSPVQRKKTVRENTQQCWHQSGCQPDNGVLAFNSYNRGAKQEIHCCKVLKLRLRCSIGQCSTRSRKCAAARLPKRLHWHTRHMLLQSCQNHTCPAREKMPSEKCAPKKLLRSCPRSAS